MAVKKTPQIVKKLLAQHRARIAWIDDILRIKATVALENQAEHVRNHSVEYYEGMAWGANAVIEEVLSAHNCYHGFQNVGPIMLGVRKVNGPSLVREDENEAYTFPIVRHTDPTYQSWRRLYLEAA